MSNRIGLELLGLPLSFQFSIQGAVLWLAIVIVLAWLASYWPARNASNLKIRETLAYE